MFMKCELGEMRIPIPPLEVESTNPHLGPKWEYETQMPIPIWHIQTMYWKFLELANTNCWFNSNKHTDPKSVHNVDEGTFLIP